jgi:hypothetical protein
MTSSIEATVLPSYEPMAIRVTGTYTDWHWPAAPNGYSSFDWQLTPHTDPSPDGYFWSHQFWLVGGEAGYVGLQTRGSEPTGKIAIFSIWDAVNAHGPAFVARFDGEGEGFSVRIPWAWEVHRTYNLRVTATAAHRWTAYVDDRLIGHIDVPSQWGGLRDVSIMWTERYAGAQSSCGDIAYAVARFGVPTADGGSVVPNDHRNYLSAHVGCPGSLVTDVAGGVEHVVGGPPEDSG